MCKMRLVALAAILIATASCAGYSVQEGGMGPGYDVYAPEPYLQGAPSLVETGGEKVLAYTFTVIWLPNYSKRYRVRSWAGLGKADFTFTFSNGWQLTGLNDKSDNSNVLAQVTDLAKHLLPANPFGIAAKAGVDVTGVVPQLEPLLYKIEFDGCGSPTCLRRIAVAPGAPCPPK